MEVTELDSLCEGEEEFEQQLLLNLEHWKAEGIRSVQIKFRPPKCQLMNVAARHGFYFHHANTTTSKDPTPVSNGYVLMCLWLDPSTPTRIPNYSHHYLGVGGVVLNSRNELLMI